MEPDEPVDPELPDEPPPEPVARRPIEAAPVGSEARAATPRAPPAPADMAPTSGVTNRIRAGIANSASTIRMRPVRTAMNPVPSSWNTFVPASWNAAA